MIGVLADYFRVGPECQGNTGAAHGEKEMGKYSDKGGSPLANRCS